VIEDEPRIASFVTRALTAQGFAVERVPDGETGLARAREAPFAMVVLDLLLPGIDGTEVLERLIESRPEQRILVLSAMAEVETRVHCLERGAVDFLAKPFSLAELTARIRARLREPAAIPMDRFVTVGRLRLDLARRTVDAGSGAVSLTDREFTLLHELALAGGDVRSREELLQAVWGLSHDPGSNVVEVYVARIRSKVDDDAIETIRGVGYRLDVP
jgi:two-component system copper resistance phosphate regulon response regulator CusR